MSDSPVFSKPQPATERYDTHIPNPWVKGNGFLSKTRAPAPLSTFAEARADLPDPFWSGHAATIACYWRAWELAFGNLKAATPENGFCADFCDTAFNGNLFMWDSAFVCGYGVYARRAFAFQNTLDNFYAKQHADGFICREISEADGTDSFHRFDPSSTGPNVLAWAEWNHYLQTGDDKRLEMVFAPLVAYHQWLRTYRTWPDGSYWSTGWGTGMDNLPRLKGEERVEWASGHLSWVDATLQAILSAKVLLRMASSLGRGKEVAELREEAARLDEYVNRNLWSERSLFYCDRYPDGTLSPVKHIGAYWALLAGCVPHGRLPGLVAHLENPAEFNRPHRVPALSADDPAYSADGGYWCGGVWAPTNYMVLKGLDQAGRSELAHQIALNHLDNVVRVYEQENTPWTGADQFRQFFHLQRLEVDDHHTLWENYAPEAPARGGHSKPGYVGWTGLPPIAVLLEDVFGLVPNAPENRLTWTVRLLDEHGVGRYPFGASGRLDLKCHARSAPLERPTIEVHANLPLRVELIWEGGHEIIDV